MGIRIFWMLGAMLSLAPMLRAQDVTVSGYLTEKGSGEALIGGTVVVPVLEAGAYTNEYGFFSLTVPAGEYEIVFKYLGYTPITQTVNLSESLQLDIDLEPEGTEIETVEIIAEDEEAKEAVQSTRMGAIKMNMKEISMVPVLGGETDVLKVMQLMPGVSQGAEGTTGMFVRGGDADQNLVLLDEAIVYNTGHLFGFFSVFNPDALKDMTMIKGAFPAQYGGRLSSVLDLRQKEGDMNEFHFKGGIGLLSSRLNIEGPIIRDKLSFSVSGRRTYIDQVFRLAGITIPYYFYDLNAKVNYKISNKDRIYFSSYFGDDVLSVSEDVESEDTTSTNTDLLDFGFRLGNFTQTLRWNHLFSNKLFANFSLIHTTFKYNIQGSFLDNSILITSRIRDLGAKADFDYFLRPETHLKYGAGIIYHRFRPNVVATTGEVSDFLGNNAGNLINNQEVYAYGGLDQELSPRLKVNAGLRLSGSFTQGTTFYPGVEPRISARYTVSEFSSVKASYSRMYQYMHRVSSSTVALPTDLWYPVTARVAAQNSDQVAVGWHQFLPRAKLEVTVEGYYKRLRNLIEYREGASLILNDNFEDELVSGKGDSYGLELLLRRKQGRITGWLGYTLSWSTRDFPDLNGGQRYFARYDRRHDLSLVGIFEITERFSASGVFVFQNGSRFTAQVGQYFQPNASLTGVDVVPIYSDRNAIRMAPTHRLDLNFILKSKPLNSRGNARKFHTEWHFGAYNVYNRAAPYRVDVAITDNGYRYQQPGLFGMIPFIAFNFEY
ncbi:MAG: TonB-dependent receptor [Bacteroidota bacterium]